MSFPRYEKYKDSGVEWLGEVPEGWTVASLKHGYSIIGGSTPKSDSDTFWDGDIVWVTPADLSKLPGLEVADSARKITQAGLDSCGTSLVPSGSVILSTRAPIGTLGIAAKSLCTNQGCKALVPQGGQNSRYCAYLLLVSTGELNILGRGTTFLELSGDALGKFPFPLPSLPEQRTIAAFLDHETGKIDALVAEQEKLIGLLKEKRQAVISHAVTKGLDPNAKMKDSGVEWLGEVPEGWEVKPLKHISPFITVGIVVNPSNYLSDEGLPFIYGGDIREGCIDFVGARRITIEKSQVNSKTILRSGDLLTVRVGAPGVTAVVPPECEGGNCASVMLVRKGNYDSRWLCFAMNDRVVRYQVEIVQYGAAQEQFNISHAVNFLVPTPPLESQVSIAAFLDHETAKFDALIEEAQKAIELMKERRTALISAAVTGKIDVRGYCLAEEDEGV
ncbi:MAG: restriction endonuclease subunit S [Trichloromonas sp.]|jgi:type I restriction enzyme S subunit|nr:restriction endonuclease subunit S [Trichloromonas sp.]